MIKSISKNFGKPQGFIGSMLLTGMNKGHDKLTRWALSHVEIHPESTVLDIGCGGGNAISLMAQSAGKVYGVDYSEVSIKKSSRKNAYSIAQGKVEVRQASVSSLPFTDGMFDLVTAFETIYFWPDLQHDFAEVYRVVKPGGCFMAVFQNGKEEETSRRMEHNIDGMKIPEPKEVETLFRQAGFSHVAVFEEAQHSYWKDLSVIGKK